MPDRDMNRGESDRSPAPDSRLVLLSVSHRHASVDLREQLAFNEETRIRLLADIQRFASEVVAIITCNRTEIYLSSTLPEREVRTGLLDALTTHSEIDRASLKRCSYVATDTDAARHLFRVASGIDSAILGEPQIIGQVRDSLLEARQHQTTGPLLERLFQRALATGKRARSRTRIGDGAGSISHAAVQLAREAVGDLSDKRALAIGVGEMGCLVARNLVAHGVRDVTICNRTNSRAALMASQLNGRVAPWEHLGDAIASSDIVITATGSSDYVVTPQHFLNGHARKEGDNVLVIDIAVPRNVDPDVGRLPDVHLFGIDDLQSVQAAGIQQREREIPRVEAIIEEELTDFMQWVQRRKLAPIISELYSRSAELRDREVEKALRRLGHLDERDKQVVRAMAHGLMQKMLHTPVVQLKGSEESDSLAGALSRLFSEPFPPDRSTPG